VKSNDIRGIDFIVFEELPTTIVTGVVEGLQLEKWQQNLRVEFVTLSEPSRVEQTVTLPLSHFFEVQGLPKWKYTAQLLFDLSEKTIYFRYN
jgi:hypothetical protein